MKALVWEAPSQMSMHNKPEPKAVADEVVIKVGHVGICGSELSGYLGHNALRVPPIIMGHEFAGEITAVGDNVTEFETGQLVTVNPLIYCGRCEYCQRGLNQLCVNRLLLGAHRPGAFAEYISAPAYMVSVLSDQMTTRTGALVEPTACGVRIGELVGDVREQDCLVIGGGPIGLVSMQVLILNGAKRVFISELDKERRAMGESLGGIPINPGEADPVAIVKEATDNIGAAVSIDAVGRAKTREQCIQATHATGTVILSGLHEESSVLPTADIIRGEIHVKGAFAYSPANFAVALQLLAENQVQLDPWIVEAPLEEGNRWFERLIHAPGNVSKVLLVP